jgi:hypothetical protein
VLIPLSWVIRYGAFDRNPSAYQPDAVREKFGTAVERRAYLAKYTEKWGEYDDTTATFERWLEVLTTLEDRMWFVWHVMLDDTKVGLGETERLQWQGKTDLVIQLKTAAWQSASDACSLLEQHHPEFAKETIAILTMTKHESGPWGLRQFDECKRRANSLMCDCYNLLKDRENRRKWAKREITTKEAHTERAIDSCTRAVSTLTSMVDSYFVNAPGHATDVILSTLNAGADMTATNVILDDLWRRLCLHNPKSNIPMWSL